MSPSPTEHMWPSTNRKIYHVPECRKIWFCVGVQIHWTAPLSPVQCGPSYRHSVIFCKLWSTGDISVPVVSTWTNTALMQQFCKICIFKEMSPTFCKNCSISTLLCKWMTQIVTGNGLALQHHSGNLQSKFKKLII
jgi:hypothetical protein